MGDGPEKMARAIRWRRTQGLGDVLDAQTHLCIVRGIPRVIQSELPLCCVTGSMNAVLALKPEIRFSRASALNSGPSPMVARAGDARGAVFDVLRQARIII